MESGLAVENEQGLLGRPLDKSFDDLVRDVELEQYLFRAKSVADLNKMVEKLLGRHGINRFAHTDLTTLNGILDPVGNFDPKVTDRYVIEGFPSDDFMSRHLLLDKSQKPIFRSDIQRYVDSAPFESDFFKRNVDISKFLTEVGMEDCYNIPLKTGGLFSVSIHYGKPDSFREIVNRNIKFVHQIAEAVDHVGRTKFMSKFHAAKITRLPLCPRPLEILNIMANKDLNAAETARLLGIHEVTVNKHIAAAKKALRADTLLGLLMAAIRGGMISVFSENLNLKP